MRFAELRQKALARHYRCVPIPSHSQYIEHTAWSEEREPHFVVSLLWPYVCRYEKSYVVSAMKPAVVWPGAILSVSGLLRLGFENQRLNWLKYMLQEAKTKMIQRIISSSTFFLKVKIYQVASYLVLSSCYNVTTYIVSSAALAHASCVMIYASHD